jgi:hypothetical protein
MKIKIFFYKLGFKLSMLSVGLIIKSKTLLNQLAEFYYILNTGSYAKVKCNTCGKLENYPINQWAVPDSERIHLCSNKCIDIFFKKLEADALQAQRKYMNDVVNNDGN